MAAVVTPGALKIGAPNRNPACGTPRHHLRTLQTPWARAVRRPALAASRVNPAQVPNTGVRDGRQRKDTRGNER